MQQDFSLLYSLVPFGTSLFWRLDDGSWHENHCLHTADWNTNRRTIFYTFAGKGTVKIQGQREMQEEQNGWTFPCDYGNLLEISIKCC